MTHWEAFGHEQFPARVIPPTKQARLRLHKDGDPVWGQDPEVAALPQPFQTKIQRASVLRAAALRPKVPFSVVLCASWSLAEDLVAVLHRRKKDWRSLLKKNRTLETNSFVLKDAAGKRLPLAGPHLSVEALGPLLPVPAYRAVPVGDKPYWTFTLAVRSPGLGKVRLGISVENAALTGTSAVVVTTRTDWTAQRILATSLQRWPLETCYQEGKEPLGLDE